MKDRRATDHQQVYLELLKDGHWHRVDNTYTRAEALALAGDYGRWLSGVVDYRFVPVPPPERRRVEVAVNRPFEGLRR